MCVISSVLMQLLKFMTVLLLYTKLKRLKWWGYDMSMPHWNSHFQSNPSNGRIYEPRHDKTNKMSVHPANTRISLRIHPVRSVFAIRSMGSWGSKVSSCGQKRLIRLDGCPGWSESSLGAHSVGFVMLWLIYDCQVSTNNKQGNTLSIVFHDDKPYVQENVSRSLNLGQSTVMILIFRTDRPGQTVQTQIRAVWSGSTLFVIPSASFRSITVW